MLRANQVELSSYLTDIADIKSVKRKETTQSFKFHRRMLLKSSAANSVTSGNGYEQIGQFCKVRAAFIVLSGNIGP